VQLNFPNYAFRLRKHENRNQIFDEVRKKWLVCTPEEWVRQHLIQWLINEKSYPAANLAIEAGLKLNQLKKRTDLVCYKNGQPFLIIECKAPSVPIKQGVFNQLFRYNQKIGAPFLGVTNGLQHFFAAVNADGSGIIFLEELPVYTPL
jgi:hypothetical protein